MSFSYDIKYEIMSAAYKNACCRRALLDGILASKANVTESGVVFNTENNDTAVFANTLIKEIFGNDGEIGAPLKGGRCKTVTFRSKSAAAYINSQNGSGRVTFSERCTLCKMAFLRGVFFSTGRMTDPSKQFCLEFSLGNKIDAFAELFRRLGLEMKISLRGTEKLLYTKNSTVIEDFFSMAELNNATFEVMNIKIANELKNNANRLRNFDTVNITKAVDAANAQITVIRELERRNLLGSLPSELESTARMRLENPDMSLSQLAIHSVPAVTKSGITHRLKKIMEFGEKLLKKYD